MGLLAKIKVEIVCITFGLFGFVIAITGNRPEVGTSLCSTSITAYFAFKKSGEDNSE